MPRMDIVNWMDRPSIGDQREDRQIGMADAYSKIRSNMLQGDIADLQLQQARQKRDLLQNFEGDFDSPEFYKEAMRVDPKMAKDVGNRLSKLDEQKREALRQRMEQIGSMAMMADTPEKWKQAGIPSPWESRDQILSQVATFDQAMDISKTRYERAHPEAKGTALQKNTKFLESIGFNQKDAINMLLKSREETPEKFEQDMYQQLRGNGIITDHEEAAAAARAAREHYYPGATGRGVTGAGQQFQSSAGPARSGSDFSGLWR